MSDSRPGASKPEKEYKEFRATSFAVDHSTSILVLLAFIVVAGLMAYRAIPRESFPETEIPMIAVNTIYPGVSPADMESLITRKIEEELNTISDVKELTSTSIEGYSSVVVEFETSVDLNEALQKVREKVDLAKPELPTEAEDPAIMEFNFSEAPIMQVNLAGEYGLVRLKELAEDLQERLEGIPAVLRADVRGGLEREVQVDLNLSKLKYYNVSIDDILEAIRLENVNIPGGSIDVGGMKYLVRIDGEFDDPSVIEDVVITTIDGRPIYVKDIATVDFGFAERESFARLGDEPVVTLDVIKRSGENIIETSEAVRAEVEAMRSTFPPSTVVSFTSDMSEDIHEMVTSLENNIVSGLILIVGVLLFVLGLRTSMFVAVSIPTSMLLSFIALGMMGVTLNMVVLFSLILALGMLVDNAIVVVENIYRFVEEGWDRKTAAKKATGEVAIPVISATATTVAAFVPLMFWPGMVGDFMGYLPLTLIVSLTSSLFVALIIIPTLCSMYLRIEGDRPKPLTPPARWAIMIVVALVLLGVGVANPLTAVLFVVTGVGLWLLHTRILARVGKRFMDDGLPTVLDWYERRLRWSLDHRWMVVGGSVAAMVATFMLYGAFGPAVEYFPEDIPPAQIWIDVEAPVGTRAEVTDSYVRRLKAQLAGLPGMADAKSIVTTVGSGGGGNPMMGAGPGGPEAGRITISVVDYQDQTQDAFETLAVLQKNVGVDLAGADVKVDKMQEGPASGPPVNIEIVGDDPVMLKALADQAIQRIEASAAFPKLVGLESDMNDARPELRVRVDREKAKLYGLSTNDVGFGVRGAINGIEAAKYRTGDDEYDIIVRLRKEDRSELSALASLTVLSEGQQVPLLSVADWEVEEGYGSIKRKDLDRVATVSAEVAAGYNPNATRMEVEGVLASFTESLPPGYTLRFTGEQQEQQEAMDFLALAFMGALMLIAMILVSQFNSVVKPFIILSSVILSTIGVMLGLIVFQMPFVIIMTGVGIISLAGIVVNNAIILIDYIDILRGRDEMNRREALVQGGKTRLRPVLLTAFTTALGLVPLAIGLNIDFFGLYGSLSPDLFWGGDQAAWWGPMAVAVIVGIIFATFLTLILVPVMYSMVDDASDFFKRHFVGKDDTAGDERFGAGSRDLPHVVPPLRPRPGREREVAAVFGDGRLSET